MENTPISRLVRFLGQIGISASEVSADWGSVKPFLPSVVIQNGRLLYHADSTLEDLLHEAGHLAVMPKRYWDRLSGDLQPVQEAIWEEYIATHPNAFSDPEDPHARALLQAGESEASAWSWLAGMHLRLHPTQIINSGFGGRQAAVGLRLGLGAGRHPGFHGLFHAGMVGREFGEVEVRKWVVKKWVVKKWVQDA